MFDIAASVMQITVDLDTLEITPCEGLAGVFRKASPFSIRFLSRGVTIDLGSGASVYLAATVDGELVAGGPSLAADVTKTGSGESALYSGMLNFNTAPIAEFFAAGKKSVAVHITVNWATPESGPGESLTYILKVTDYNSSGDEGSPEEIPELKASQAQAEAGENNEFWMTPFRTFQAIAAWIEENLTVTWSAITGKPSTFPPVIHTHNAADIDGLEDFLSTGPKGDTGDVGPKGETGDVGPKGDTGDVGPKGDTGDVGPKGDTGDVGPKGDTGDVGPKGDAGDVGPKGDTGDVGPKGETGDVGPKGDTGDVGPKGDTGDVGPKGDTGDVGPKGDTGDVGPKGDTGDVGPKGDTGDVGPKGDTGDVGPKGDTGDVGPKGDTGDVGPRGEPGEPGISASLFPLGSSAYSSGGEYPTSYTIKAASNAVIGVVVLTYNGSNKVTSVATTDANGDPIANGNWTISYDGSGNLTSAVCTN